MTEGNLPGAGDLDQAHVRRLYEEMFATFYDNTHCVASLAEWSIIRETIVNRCVSREALTVVDTGAGTGRYALPILSFLVRRRVKCNYLFVEPTVTGKEVASEKLRSAFRLARGARNALISDLVRVSFHDTLPPPTSELRADLVISMLSYLSHLPSTGERVNELSRMRAWLKEDGFLILSLPNRRNTWPKAQRAHSGRTGTDGSGDCFINPFAFYPQRSREEQMFCHAFSVAEIDAMLAVACPGWGSRIMAAKLSSMYSTIGRGAVDMFRNASNALRCCWMLDRAEIERAAFDFLVVTSLESGVRAIVAHPSRRTLSTLRGARDILAQWSHGQHRVRCDAFR